MKQNYHRIRRGKRTYYINVPRLIVSMSLVVAVFVFGGMFAVRCVRTWGQKVAFRQRFSTLYVEELPSPDAEITRCIVISPGHGGDDPGACFGTVQEKDINLSIALLVRDLLQEKGYTVLMTRTHDMEADNTTAIAEANESGVDILIAIHQNAAEQAPDASGIEIWFEQGHTDSEVLADMVQTALIERTGAEDRGTKSDQSFELTRETRMPAILIETGFLTNEAEVAKLLDESYQQTIAQGIVQGIETYFAQENLPASTFSFEQ